MLKSKKFLRLTQNGSEIKLYDYNGKKNICGEKIRSARKAIKLSQQELAARLQIEGGNIERDSISRMEIGTRFIADFELKALCKILPFSKCVTHYDTFKF